MLLRLPAIHLQLSTVDTWSSRVLRSSLTGKTIALVLMLVAVPSASAVDSASGQPSASPQTPPSAVLIDPKTAKDFNQRGTSKAQNGDLEGAIADFDQAIRLKLDYATAYYNRGTAYARTGNVRAALADYTQVIALKPNNAAVRYSRGLLRANTGDRAGAIVDFQQAAALFKQEGNTVFFQKAQDYIKQLQPV
ncbi:MAG: tetratricopeptide repeat protein [Stenomitos frigidus ULC029]